MPDVKIQEKLDTISEGVAAVQVKVTAQEKKIDGINPEIIKKAGDDAAKALVELQEMEQKQKAADNEMIVRVKAIEKAVVNGSGNPDKSSNPEHKLSMYSYMSKGTTPTPEAIQAYCEDVAKRTLLHGEKTKLESYTKDLVEGSNPAGGFFMVPERSTQIMSRVFETSACRLVCNLMSTSSSSIDIIIDDDEAACGWVGEVQARPKTASAEIGLKTIPIHEIYAAPQASQSMLDDAGFDIEGWHQGKVTDKISRTENTSFVVGNGSKKPKGFLAYPAWDTAGVYQRDAVEQIVATGTAATLDEPDDLITLQGALHEPYQSGAVFAGTRTTFTEIMKMKDTVGQYLLNPLLLKEGTSRMILDKRYIVMSDIQEVAANSLSVVYGNFGVGYSIVDRFGIRVLRDPYTNKPFVIFYTTKRVGADVTNFEAIKILKINAS